MERASKHSHKMHVPRYENFWMSRDDALNRHKNKSTGIKWWSTSLLFSFSFFFSVSFLVCSMVIICFFFDFSVMFHTYSSVKCVILVRLFWCLSIVKQKALNDNIWGSRYNIFSFYFVFFIEIRQTFRVKR